MIAGVALAFGGLYLVLVEFRSRVRAAESVREAEEAGTRDLATEAVKATPEILRAFAELKPAASLLVIAALLFLCATVLAWRGL